MSAPSATRTVWRRALLVATIVAFVLFAAHPELRLLLPLLDAVGLDVFVLLLGGQLWSYAAPVVRAAWRLALRPGLRYGYRAAIWSLGILGPFVDDWLTHRLPRGPSAPVAAA